MPNIPLDTLAVALNPTKGRTNSRHSLLFSHLQNRKPRRVTFAGKRNGVVTVEEECSYCRLPCLFKAVGAPGVHRSIPPPRGIVGPSSWQPIIEKWTAALIRLATNLTEHGERSADLGPSSSPLLPYRSMVEEARVFVLRVLRAVDLNAASLRM